MVRFFAAVCIMSLALLPGCGRGGQPIAGGSAAAVDTTVAQAPSMIGARHILIQYAGAQSSTSTRTKDEALQLITALRDSIQAGRLSFEDAAIRHSDCPSGAQGGYLGVFGRGAMVPEFENAAFGLRVGEMSGIVETPFGYHLIKRTE